MKMPSFFFLSHLPIPGMLFSSRKARVSDCRGCKRHLQPQMSFLFVFLCSPNTHSARLREHFNGLSFPAACWSTAEGTIWALNVTADVLGVPIGHHQPLLFALETTKKRASGEYARISCLSVRTSGRPSPVSAAKDDTTDENGEDHIHLLDAETSPFVSSEKQVHAHYSIFFRR